jgi:hypothetical protein
VAVDDGFGMELEELLLVLAYIVEKSRGGIMYHAGSRRPTRTRVYSTRGTCMVASNPPRSWSGRSSTKKLIVWMSAVATCAHNHGSWSLVWPRLEEEERNLATQRCSMWSTDDHS